MPRIFLCCYCKTCREHRNLTSQVGVCLCLCVRMRLFVCACVYDALNCGRINSLGIIFGLDIILDHSLRLYSIAFVTHIMHISEWAGLNIKTIN